MSAGWLAGGLALVVLATVDALWTILWVDGHAGPLTKRVTGGTSAAFVALLSRLGHFALSVKGPLILATSIVFWVVLHWIGWTMVFSASPTAVLHTHTGAAASLVERVYFVGYTMFTLGNGDFTPSGALFQVLAALVSLNGLVLVTLVVTYLLSVIEAVVKKRSFAGHVAALGHSAEDVVRSAWDGRSFAGVDLQLISLTEQINMITEQHQAYPMVHYFHAAQHRQSTAMGFAVFDDALTLFDAAIPADRRPTRAQLRVARASVWSFLETLQNTYITPSDAPPPLPDLRRLRDAGIPTLADADFAAAAAESDLRRKLLAALVEAERRPWPNGVRAGSGS